jgi:transposase
MYWIGVDHHKRNTYVTSLDREGKDYFRGNLSAKAEDLRRFFAGHPRPFTVGIEATYAWEYVADIVEGMGETICVGHPLLLKAFARRHKKNDKVDSALSAHLLWRGDFPRIAHPPQSARLQRDLYRQRMELVVRRTSAVSRAKALADRLGFQAMMDLATLKGLETFAGLPFPLRSHTVVESHVSYLTFLYHAIKRLEQAIDQTRLEAPEIGWLRTVPGIGSYLALLIASEVFDIERFGNARRLVSYAGLAPGAWASAGKVYASHLCSNVNKYLRWAFVETVIHYIKVCRWAQAKYERLKRAKGWKTARLAVARHVATVVYHLLKERRGYQEAPPEPGQSLARQRP